MREKTIRWMPVLMAMVLSITSSYPLLADAAEVKDPGSEAAQASEPLNVSSPKMQDAQASEPLNVSSPMMQLAQSDQSSSTVPVAQTGQPSSTVPSLPRKMKPVGYVDPDSMAPDSEARHDVNKTLGLNKLTLHSTVSLTSFKTIRREVMFDQPVTLTEALNYALMNNLAIKISKENLLYQRCVLYSSIANLLPNFSMAYNLTRTDIQNQQVNSLARVELVRIAYPVFQGGAAVYSLLGQAYRERGWKQAYKASMNDMLLTVYQNYNNLLLARVLMQIRAKAVEVSEEQLRVNQKMLKSGAGTRFAVIQSDAQLASDRQALIQQQVAVRQAALALNFSLNYPMEVNLVPVEEAVTEQSLFQSSSTITDLVNVALRRRPELREYELFKQAAGRNVQVAMAPLYPQLAFYTAPGYTNTTATGSGATSSVGSSSTSGAGVFTGFYRTVQNGMALTWSLSGLGLVSVANVFGAQSLNRQAGIQANQELQTVLQQLRSGYLSWQAAREQIDNAAHGAEASAEELRLASIRLKEGVSTNLEVIQAERDYINALTAQAQAIVGSNLAQAQLLHDTGIITTDTLLHGFKGDVR